MEDWLLQLLTGLGPSMAGAAEMPGGASPTAPPIPVPRPVVAGLDPNAAPSPGSYGIPPGMGSDMSTGIAPLPASSTPVPIPRPRPSNIPDLGASLAGPGGAGKPLDIRPPAQQAGTVQAQPQQANEELRAIQERMKPLDALKGVQAPPKPDVVKPSTPAAPTTRAVQSGDFLALLQALSNPRAAGGGPPMTLGGALGTGRY